MPVQFRLPRATGVASRLKRAGPITAALMTALVLVPSASPGTYTDPTGDGVTSGDLTSVTVAGDKGSGQLLFRITGTNLASSPRNPLFLDIDSDANPLTGDLADNGADYSFYVDDTSYGFGHWDGSNWVAAANLTVRVSGGTNEILVSVNRSDLGNTSMFNFMAGSVNLTTFAIDKAPDDGAFNYSIDVNGPEILSVDLTTSPAAGPRVGKKFVLTATGLKLPPSGATNVAAKVPESYSCTARLGQRALRGTGKGACTIAIPKKKSKGKTLRVTVTVAYQGLTKAFTYTFRVR
jgi:hypothetical protein